MDNRNILVEGLESMGIQVDNEKVQKLLQFKDILLEWNEKINLTTIVDEKEIYVKHFIDSITCLMTGYFNEGKSMIDVGTGAGFPGVPIKIMDESIDITLLDSLNKRITYLKHVKDSLKLDKVTLVHMRAEEGGQSKQLREKFDIVLSRAVANLNVLCEYCLPFAKVGGYFICQKGPKYKDELDGARHAIEVLGGKVVEVKEYQLPFSDIKHFIIIIQKVTETPSKYPRKAGKPNSEPLI